jgi:hypothetical protein
VVEIAYLLALLALGLVTLVVTGDGSAAVAVNPPALGRGVCSRHTLYNKCMTMLSFRVDDVEAEQVRRWAERLCVDRSELLRDALRRQLVRLASEEDAATWVAQPLGDGEQSLGLVADWGPAEDWSDWADGAR